MHDENVEHKKSPQEILKNASNDNDTHPSKKHSDLIKNWITIQKLIFSLHLYTNKYESTFKVIAITISLMGGVYFSKVNTITTEVNKSFYLFSIAMIMEYLVILITKKKIISRILPFIICICNIFIFVATTGVLIGNPIEFVKYSHLEMGITIPIYILWIDWALLLFLGCPNEEYIENKLAEL